MPKVEKCYAKGEKNLRPLAQPKTRIFVSLEWLLTDFERQHKFPIPEKSKEGFYEMQIGKMKHPILLKDIEPGLYFSSRLSPPPKKDREDFFIYLMKANFLGQGTGGSVIGMEKDENYLTLSLTLSYEVSYNMFKENLEDFLNYVEFWQGEIEKYSNK